MCSPVDERRGPGQSLRHTGPGLTQMQGSPSWTQWTVRLVTELDMGEQFSVNWIWSKFGQLDSANFRST